MRTVVPKLTYTENTKPVEFAPITLNSIGTKVQIW